jgi:hypothetical protein
MQMPGPYSVAVRYRTLLRYRCEGGRADPDLGPGSASVSILKPGTASFLKLNCKKHGRIHQKVGADPIFFQKIHV